MFCRFVGRCCGRLWEGEQVQHSTASFGTLASSCIDAPVNQQAYNADMRVHTDAVLPAFGLQQLRTLTSRTAQSAVYMEELFAALEDSPHLQQLPLET